MLDRLRDLFAPRRALPPVLVRVRIPGGVAEGPVEVVARRRPEGRAVATRVHASQGLCVIPWLGGEGLDLEVGHASHRGSLTVGEADVADGAVVEIALG